MTSHFKIWIMDPFHAGSHAAWSKGMKQALQRAGHDVTLHTLPGRHWKWRMHGAAATWASKMRRASPPDVLITTDMCDVAQLRGLMPPDWASVKLITMFHENQLTFPWSPHDPDKNNGRDGTYAYINLSSALVSDAIWFNSHHHMDEFMREANVWMKTMPKPHVPNLVKQLIPKARVMHLGLDLQNWEQHQRPRRNNLTQDIPTVLWNHRWAWDKGTDAFVSFARDVIRQDISAQFVILGQSFNRMPRGWETLREELGKRCLHWGYVESREEYISWLWECDVVPIEPHQEYFGISVVEAMRCEVLPWVPQAHAYPETTPNDVEFVPSKNWIDALQKGMWRRSEENRMSCRHQAMKFDWTYRAPIIAAELTRALESKF